MPGWMKPTKVAKGDLDTSPKGKAEARAMTERYKASENPFAATVKAIMQGKKVGMGTIGKKPEAAPSAGAQKRYAPKAVRRTRDKVGPDGIIERGVRP